MENVVTYFVQGNVAVVTINNPPVNALGHMVRTGLVDAISRAEADNAVRAILIHAQGRTFPAGADIKEFGKPPKDPSLPEVCDLIEASKKPVIAALHGTVLGGGLEVALACHYRIADANTKLGLPEVTLGILPGAGGTQRVPRLCGALFALDLMLSGKPVDVDIALKHGLIDGLAKADVFEVGLAMAQDVAANPVPPPRTMERADGLADPAENHVAVKNVRNAVAGSVLFAPAKIIDCIEAAFLLPPEAGKAFERAAFEVCLASDQSAALRHVFLAERMAGKVPELKNGRAREVTSVGVIGGGTMGAGIAVSLLDGGLDVVMLERDEESLKAGLGRVVAVFERSCAKGRITADGM
ncbi:MAG: enoyl-CoA hydratase/isomerase family protein, partial [Marinosulfonomonas sp.]|nr:enoyl-CoA hydratase/isomerase family protein [Marinosulfonomonas sp.]